MIAASLWSDRRPKIHTLKIDITISEPLVSYPDLIPWEITLGLFRRNNGLGARQDAGGTSKIKPTILVLWMKRSTVQLRGRILP
jgi:hypothetical protein